MLTAAAALLAAALKYAGLEWLGPILTLIGVAGYLANAAQKGRRK